MFFSKILSTTLIVGFVVSLKTTAGNQQEKKLVLVHYANETSPHGKDGDNYRSTIERLTKSEDKDASIIAASLKNDPKLFEQALQKDRSAFRTIVGRKRLGLIYCEMDNDCVRQGKIRYWLPASTEPQTHQVEKLPNRNYILENNPLATSAGLDQCLQTISKLFPPKQHRYVLITLSHGSRELAMSVKLSRKTECLNDKEFLDLLNGHSTSYSVPSLGTSKSEYLDTITKAANQYDMEFELVVLESCQGTFDKALLRKLPAKVKLFYASGHQCLVFSSIPYEELFSGIADADDVVAALDDHLHGRFLRVSRNSGHQSWMYFVWYLPLITLYGFLRIRDWCNPNRAFGLRKKRCNKKILS